jgi:hypothetical protein
MVESGTTLHQFHCENYSFFGLKRGVELDIKGAFTFVLSFRYYISFKALKLTRSTSRHPGFK